MKVMNFVNFVYLRSRLRKRFGDRRAEGNRRRAAPVSPAGRPENFSKRE
jgi:hypothetical protein